MWFGLGLALMCAAAAYLNMFVAVGLGLAALAMGATGLLLRRKAFALRVVTVVCLGMVFGLLLYGVYYNASYRVLEEVDGNVAEISATVTDYSFETEYGSAVQVGLIIDNQKFRAQLYLSNHHELEPGDQIEGRFLLKYTGGVDRTYHFGRGILLLGYQRQDVQVNKADSVPVTLIPSVIRKWVTQTIDRYFTADTAFFAKALLLGDRSDVDYETSTNFKVTGISHIIAVSGMHLSILASVVYILAGKSRGLMALFGIPTVLLFAAVAGFTPSITRACIMQILLLIAMVFDRDYDPLTSLATAAIVMLLENPMVITSVSFQLSFGCMAGIFLFSSRVYQHFAAFSVWMDAKRKTVKWYVRGWLCGSVAITLGAMAFTTPLCAVYFGCFS